MSPLSPAKQNLEESRALRNYGFHIALCVLLLWSSGCGGNSAPAAGSPPGSVGRYPLEVSSNGRYLVDQDNQPFLITGDSPQALIAQLSESEADFYFATRAAGGFNTVWINLLCKPETGGRPDGSTFDGIVPFNTPDNLATPNERYFLRADAMIRLAAKHGIVVLLNPIETLDWLPLLRSNGEAVARAYGRFVGSRYRSYDNIIWFHGNDFQDWEDRDDTALVQAVARGIQETDERHIQTVLLEFPTSGSLDDESWRPLIQLNSSYTYFPTYAQVLKDYNRPNFLPTFLAEASYEFEREGTSAHNLRKQEYWALLSGAAGQMYGNRFVWQFLDGWEDNLHTPGAEQVRHVKSLFSGRAWYNLIPDQDHVVVVSGLGTFSESGGITGNAYLTAAATPDGTLAIAYLPTRRTITVDMSRFSTVARARWYDPTAGRFQEISSALPNRGTLQLTPPAANEEGTDDWLLVIEAD